MTTWFLDDIRYVPDKEALRERVRLDGDSDEAEDFLGLVDAVAAVVRPKAFIKSAAVTPAVTPDRGDSSISIGGVIFDGELLCGNVRDLETVWPQLVTCGMEAYELVQRIPDPIEKIWGEIILEDALKTAEDFATGFAKQHLEFSGMLASISPGSLPEWPIEQQAPLFRLFGDGADKCGVTLTASMLMVPNKSVSGILFPSEHGYVSCKLCPREACPNRRAEYVPQEPMSTI